ncbi:MAG: glycosyltransferase family 4 protein [Chloroflexi bacterium]|nr:glycosyltransferase family 4 protein [Chloroflexota bacterium]
MRIALAHSHPNTFGGGERAVLEVATRLARRHEVRLLVSGYVPDATFAGLRDLPRRDLSSAEWLTGSVLQGREVVVANSFGANLLALRQPRRVVVWVHSLRSRFLQPGGRRPGLLARRVLDLIAVRRAARVAANSQFTASRFRRLYGRDADLVIYPGVSPARFPPAPDLHHPYAITVGRLSPEKGLERLLQAWAHADVRGARLVIAGAGDAAYAAMLRGVAGQSVEFLGAVPPDELARLYAGATLAVFAPHDEEFGIAPVEAMAAGVPVVAWRSGGIPETVVDGQTGFLTDSLPALAERMRYVVEHPDLARELGAAGRVRATEFSWDRTANAVEQLCRSISGGEHSAVGLTRPVSS